VIYGQVDSNEGTALIRLSDQMVVSVRDFEKPTGLFGDAANEHGFYPGVSMACGLLHEKLLDIVSKSENIPNDVKETLQAFNEYVALLSTLPSNAFKADAAVNNAIPPPEEEPKTPPATEPRSEQKPTQGKNVETKVVPGLEGNATTATEVRKEEKQEEVKKEEAKPEEKKEEAKKEEAVVEKVASTMCPSCEGTGKVAGSVCAKCGGTGKIVKKQEEVQKSEMQTVLDAISGVVTKLGEVENKVNGVVQEQSAAKKVLDGVVQKTDTLEQTLKTTVVGAPPAADRPAGELKEVKKHDDDPRTGCFDTAFIGGRRNRR